MRPIQTGAAALCLCAALVAAALADIPFQSSTISELNGDFVSLAVDGTGRPHVAWYDEASGDLLYARRDGTVWTVEVVDTTGDVGSHCSLALNGSQPGISYYDATNGNLRYARKPGSSWSRETVHSAGDVGQYTSLAYDDSGHPCISYYDVTNGDLRYAEKGALWGLQVVESSGDAGRHSSLALTSGVPAIAYVADDRVRYAVGGGPWTIQTADSGAASYAGASLALDVTGDPHIVSTETDPWTSAHSIAYLKRPASSWLKEVVESTTPQFSFSPPEIALTTTGAPHVAFTQRPEPFLNSPGKLHYAQLAAGVWTVETVTSLGFFGYRAADIALDLQNQPVIAAEDGFWDMRLYTTAYTISVTSPTASQVGVSQVVPITWNTTLSADYRLRLEYGPPGGPRTLIAASVPNTGTYPWTVPATPGPDFRVYVSDDFDGTPQGSSPSFPICEGMPAFNAFAPYSAPNDGCAGDFNEDGILDAVVCLSSPTSGFAVLIGLGTAGVGSGGFAAPVHYAVAGGLSTQDAVTGDWNGDGILDLALTRTAGIQIFLGDGTAGVGDGTFTAGSVYAVGVSPRGINVADFDEDGRPDLVVANGASSNLSILRGNGDGTFLPPVFHATGAGPSRVVVQDFNGDAIQDLAVTCASADAVSILLGTGSGGKGNGGFAAHTTFPAGDNPIGLASGDFDEDGVMDLAVACNTADGVAVLFGQGAAPGNGAFAAPVDHPFGSDARDVVVLDANRDGRADLVAAAGAGDGIAMFYGGGSGTTGDGTFAFASIVPGDDRGNQMIAGDFLEDGAPDVLVLFLDSNSLVLYASQCPPAVDESIVVIAPNGGEHFLLGAPVIVAWTRGPGIQAVNVELSRDGGANWSRLASGVTATSYLWHVIGPPGVVQLRVTDAVIPSRYDLGGGFFVSETGVLLLDPNGGEALSAFESNEVRWAAVGSSPVTLEYRAGSGPRVPIATAIADDGSEFWNVPNVASSDVRLYVTSGASTDSSDAPLSICARLASPQQHPLLVTGQGIVAADFNEDGIQDVATGGCAVQVSLGLGAGGVGNGRFGAPSSIALPGCGQDLVAADFNDDGILDLAAITGEDIAMLRGLGFGGTGNGAFRPPVLTPTGAPVSDIAVADFNEDGIEDLAVCLPSIDRVGILTGNGAGGIGDGTFGPPALILAGNDAAALVVADFNEDGIWDLATADEDYWMFVLLGRGSQGKGDGTFEAPSSYPGLGGAPLLAADVDRDGRMDLATGAIGVRRGLGNGLFGGPIVSDVGGRALTFVDLNGDASLDIIGEAGGTLHVGMGLYPPSAMLRAAGSVTLGADPQLVAPGDYLEDGILDLVALSPADSSLWSSAGIACGPGAQSIAADAPGPTTWLIGSERQITWTSSPGVHLVDVEVSRDGGSNWQVIARSVLRPSFTWTVTGPPTASARFRVRDVWRHEVSSTTTDRAIEATVSVESPRLARASFSAGFPNPGGAAIAHVLELPEEKHVTVVVLDLQGRTVATLHDGRLAAGTHTLRWEDRGVPAGVYHVRARWPGFEVTRRVVRVR